MQVEESSVGAGKETHDGFLRFIIQLFRPVCDDQLWRMAILIDQPRNWGPVRRRYRDAKRPLSVSDRTEVGFQDFPRGSGYFGDLPRFRWGLEPLRLDQVASEQKIGVPDMQSQEIRIGIPSDGRCEIEFQMRKYLRNLSQRIERNMHDSITLPSSPREWWN